MQRLTDARVGERRIRDFTISVDGSVADLTGLTVNLHKRIAESSDLFVTLRTGRDASFTLQDAANGVVRLTPDADYWDAEGDYELYLEIEDSPWFSSPATEMMLVRVKAGILITDVSAEIDPISTDTAIVDPTVVLT